MSTTHKTPGVYIQELDAFGNSVVPVATAVPAFIGYTKNTSFNGESLIKQAIKITCLADFLNFYGDKPTVEFELKETATTDIPDFTYDTKNYTIEASGTNYRMHSALKFFYANGGAECYIMTIGDYTTQPDAQDLKDAVDLFKKETEPTMLVIPDVVELITAGQTDLKDTYANAYTLQSYMIDHCGEMMNRVAILDIPRGYMEPPTKTTESVDAFRSNVMPIMPKSNSYAAAYYPWLHTTIYQPSDISIENLTNNSLTILDTTLKTELANLIPSPTNGHIEFMIQSLTGVTNSKAVDPSPLPVTATPKQTQQKEVNDKKSADAAIQILSKFYLLVLNTIEQKLNLLPPSAAMAGIYTTVDNSKGVWQAPANVSVQGVIAPAIKIDHERQQDLNVPISGKSICAIRAFKGRGNLVWGARTLDGNSNDWRYINVRRTLIFIEQSVKDAAKAYVFAPNDASTWVTVKSMISNFLTGVWKQGGLVGPKPNEAFSVSVGLGVTMSNDDIQNGIMRISVKVAVSHPAEFIEITFQQEMQKA